MPEFDAQKGDVLQVFSTLIGKLNLVFYIGSLIWEVVASAGSKEPTYVFQS